MQDIGQRIRQARTMAGLSQAQLAHKVGVIEQTIRHIEHAKRDIKVFMLFRLADALEVHVSALLGR